MSKLPDLEVILAATLEDHYLSRGERTALASVLVDSGLRDDQRAALRNRAFALAKHAIASRSAAEVVEWLEDVVRTLAPTPPFAGAAPKAWFSPGDDCWRKIVSLLDEARASIDICVFTITDDRIADAILAAHRRGVAVRILTDNDKANDEGSDARRLFQGGVAVRVDQTPFHMHHKFAIFDGATLLTGSYNWTRGAARDNEENIVVLPLPGVVKQFRDVFEALWQRGT